MPAMTVPLFALMSRCGLFLTLLVIHLPNAWALKAADDFAQPMAISANAPNQKQEQEQEQEQEDPPVEKPDQTQAEQTGKKSDEKSDEESDEKPQQDPAWSNQPGAVQPYEYGKWESLGSADLSPDGRWLVYAISRVNEHNELRLRMLATDQTTVIAHASNPQFSADSQWLVYLIGVSPEVREKKEKAKETIKNRLGLRNLVTGHSYEVKDVASYSLSDNGRYLVLRRYPASRGASSGGGGANESAASPRVSAGVDVILRDLATASSGFVDTSFGNVAAHAFCEDHSLLGMIVHTPDPMGNGVQVYHCDSGMLRTLDSADTGYSNLSWRKESTDLAVLKQFPGEEKADKAYAVLAWPNLAESLADPQRRRFLYDPSRHPQQPADLRVVDFGGLQWSDDGQCLFVGWQAWDKRPQPYRLDPPDPNQATEETDSDSADTAKAGTKDQQKNKQKQTEPTAADESGSSAKTRPAADAKPEKSLRESLQDPAGVEVWHAKDIEIIPLQKKQVTRDKNRFDLAAWWLEDDRLVRLGSESLTRVTLLEGQKRALGYDNTPYEELKRFGPTLNDLVLIDVQDGQRKVVVPRNKFAYPSSPDGEKFLYLKENQWWVYDAASDSHRDLTSGLEVAFHNTRLSTLTEEKPPWGLAGWTEDSGQVLLYDEFDIWAFPLKEESSPRRLTDGRPDSIRHRRVVLDPEEDRWIQPEQPLLVSLYGDLDKRSGYASVNWAADPPRTERAIWKAKGIGRLIKAKEADVYAYVQQTVEESPNLFVANDKLGPGRIVSDTNPFQKEYSWSRAELIDYTNQHGQALQGALYYPAGYQEGRRYPMIVYIYEERSQGLHQYTVPSERRPYNNATFTADGYFVFEPDIVYRPQNPGLSALECVVPAVKKVLETDMIDEKRIGLIGHSWGAYQTSFIVTQTDLFAAGIAGAPLTNMMSMSMSIYWNTGQTDSWIFHESQGRMNQPFWQDVETYIKNSPIFSIDQMETPLLIAFGDEDGAVDFNQGVELYNAARLAGKQFVMLVYPGENHGLAKKPNQVDYHYRIRQWFGHYLKGDPPPSWITEGHKHLDRQREIEKLKEKSEK